MNYRLKFLPTARKQWDELDNSIKKPLHNKLRAALENPHVPKNKLRNYDGFVKSLDTNSGKVITSCFSVLC